MDAYDELFSEEHDEIMRDVWERKARVSEMYERFGSDPRFFEEERAKFEAEGWKFVECPASEREVIDGNKSEAVRRSGF